MNFEKYLPSNFVNWIKMFAVDASDITIAENQNMYVSINGITKDSDCYVSKEILAGIVNKICNGSIYANQNTLRYGYITIESGDRIGVTGTITKSDDGKNVFLKDINAINIRISRNVLGAANHIMPHIVTDNLIHNTLIIAPPSSGKTTILKDIARQAGNIFRVGIADERCELAQSYNMTKHTVAIKGTTKHEAMLMLLRSMAPQVIITDEIGTDEDEEAIKKLLNAGVKIICTAHGYSEKDIIRRNTLNKLVTDNVFEKIIVISNRTGPGTIEKIIDTKER